jgi:hypothetical protein
VVIAPDEVPSRSTGAVGLYFDGQRHLAIIHEGLDDGVEGTLRMHVSDQNVSSL